MTALTGTEKSRISRERAKLGLVRLDVWVPADKLQACRDAIDQIMSDARMEKIMMQKLLEAGSAQTAIIHRAQAILTQYLIPDGIDGPTAIDQLLGLLDGPDQRAAESEWQDAVMFDQITKGETNAD